MVKILFIHQNFPGQFIHISKYLRKKFDVYSMSFNDTQIKGIKHYQCEYSLQNKLNNDDLSIEFETKVIRAKIVSEKCNELKEKGFIPDIIIAHSGWGEPLLLKNIWINVKIISYMEYYYNIKKDMSINRKHKITFRNAPYLLSIVNSDFCISPTEYQKKTFPKIAQKKIKTIFEGVNTKFFKKKNIDLFQIGVYKSTKTKWKHAIIEEGNKTQKFSKIYNINPKKHRILTFVSRDLTPLRGYDIFLKSLPNILKKFPNTYVIIVGGDGNSYIQKPEGNKSYMEIYWNKIKKKINSEKIFFLGNIKKKKLVDVFSISTANVYITEPFCLSWSFMEALSTEVLMITNNSQPMNNIVTHGKNALFFKNKDHRDLTKKIIEVFKNTDNYHHLKKSARKLIKTKYDLYNVSIPKYEKIINKLIKK